MRGKSSTSNMPPSVSSHPDEEGQEQALTTLADKLPLFIMAALLVVGALGLGHVRYLYVRENRDRARRTAGWGAAEFAEEKKSELRRGEQRLYHRMVL